MVTQIKHMLNSINTLFNSNFKVQVNQMCVRVW